jgi:DNA-binding XRE family transcriptional regulator
MKTHTHHRLPLGGSKTQGQYFSDLRLRKPEAYEALKNPEPLACLAFNIIDLRCKKGWSQGQLAEKAGVAPRLIGYIESFSSKSSPSVKNVQSIAKALGVNFKRLFEDVDLTKD